MITTINNAIAKKREDGEKGFTLIELLVVILIIGVLAAIAIPAFLNQREGAWVNQVESDVRNATIALEQYATDNNGSYVAATAPITVGAEAETALADWGFNSTEGVTVTFTAISATAYTLTGIHENLKKDAGGDRTFIFDSEEGKIVDSGK